MAEGDLCYKSGDGHLIYKTGGDGRLCYKAAAAPVPTTCVFSARGNRVSNNQQAPEYSKGTPPDYTYSDIASTGIYTAGENAAQAATLSWTTFATVAYCACGWREQMLSGTYYLLCWQANYAIRYSTPIAGKGLYATHIDFERTVPEDSCTLTNNRAAKLYFASTDGAWATLGTPTLADVVSGWTYATVPGGISGDTGALALSSSVLLGDYIYIFLRLDNMYPSSGEYEHPGYIKNKCQMEYYSDITLTLSATP